MTGTNDDLYNPIEAVPDRCLWFLLGDWACG